MAMRGACMGAYLERSRSHDSHVGVGVNRERQRTRPQRRGRGGAGDGGGWGVEGMRRGGADGELGCGSWEIGRAHV